MFKKITKYKYTFVVVAFLLIATGVYGFTSLNKPAETEYKTATSTKGNVSVSLAADGKSVIDKRELTFEVGGIVRGVNVTEGQEITAWKTLAYLDTRDAQKNLENEMRNYLIQRNDFEEMKQVTYPEVSVISDSVKRILEKNQWNLEKAVADYELKDLVVKKSYL